MLKGKERDTDTNSIRGFSTDQRICILSMNIDKKRLQHEKDESLMVGLSIQEAALGRQLESAEARAVVRCPSYKASNMYWRRVDELVKQHDDLVQTISERTASLFSKTESNDVEEEVNEFLNQKSPDQKRKFKDLVSDGQEVIKLFDVEESIDVDDHVNVSYGVKEEKLRTTKNVSTSKKSITRSKKSY